MKKTILTIAIIIGVFALSGTSENMDVQISYSLFWLGEMLLPSVLLKRELSK